MEAAWFDMNWVWIGSCLGLVLAFFLFFTNKLRSNLDVPRYKDLYWLGWACSLAYFIHNFEEYGIDITGMHYGFPATIERLSGMLGGSGDVPALFFTVVNVSMVWIAFPLLAAMGKKHPLTSLVLASMLLVNAITHTMPLIIGVGYTSGAVSAIALFYPLVIWMFVLSVGEGKGKLPVRSLLVAIGIGVLCHIVLMGSVLLYVLRGAYDGEVLVAIQVLNAALLVGLGWLAGRSKLGAVND